MGGAGYRGVLYQSEDYSQVGAIRSFAKMAFFEGCFVEVRRKPDSWSACELAECGPNNLHHSHSPWNGKPHSQAFYTRQLNVIPLV